MQEVRYGPSDLKVLTQTVDSAERAGLSVVLDCSGHGSRVSGGNAPAPMLRMADTKLRIG